MRLVKVISHIDKRQIWRMLISEGGKLLLETRDPATKEVFYHCIRLDTCQGHFYDLQLDEKLWLGVETVYKEIAYFHKFPKPDLPGHKEIIAFDLESRRIIWRNGDLSFLLAADGKIVGYRQAFEERHFTALDYLTGSPAEDYGPDYSRIIPLKEKSELEARMERYLFPEVYFDGAAGPDAEDAVKSKTGGIEVSGSIEFARQGDLFMFSYHEKESSGLMTNRFAAFDLGEKREILSETLNVKAASLFTDSFFIFEKNLFLLKEKNEVHVFRIEEN